jgi:hypothetical protein
VDIHTYIHIYIHTYTYAYIHTNIHTLLLLCSPVSSAPPMPPGPPQCPAAASVSECGYGYVCMVMKVYNVYMYMFMCV